MRAARDNAWTAHRAALTAPTADAFEAAMRADDGAGVARLAGARELAAQRERAVSLAGVEADRARAEAELDAAERDLNGLAHEIAALLPTPPPAGRNPLGFLEGWRTKRDEALALVDALHAKEAAFYRIAEDAKRALHALSLSLREAGVAHDPEDSTERLVEAAEAALAAAIKADAARAKVREKRAEAGRAEGRLKAAMDAEARWREEWRQAFADTWLDDGAALPTVGAMRQTLKALDDLRAGLKDCAELDHRIEAMARDRSAFADEVAAVASQTGGRQRRGRRADCGPDRRPRRLGSGRAPPPRRKGNRRLTAAREKRRAIVEALAINEKLAAAMTGLFGVATLADVAAKLDDCKRRDALREEMASGGARNRRRQRRGVVRSRARRARRPPSAPGSNRNSATSTCARRRTRRFTPSVTPPLRRRRKRSPRSAATTRSRASRKSGRRSSRRSRRAPGAI